jgi:PAS domain S-box-containing protein
MKSANTLPIKVLWEKLAIKTHLTMGKKTKLYEQILEILSFRKRIGKTGQKLVNKSFLNSEMRYRRLFETAKDGILILDPLTAKIVDANPFIIKILKNTPENIIGKQLWEIGLFNNKEESKEAFDELKRDRFIRFDDMPLQRSDGQKVEVEFVSNVYQVNNIDVIQCNIRDITERKRADEALRENEELLSKTQHIAHIGSFSYNYKDEEIKWSDEMYNILGLQKDAFKLTFESFINCIHPDDRISMISWIEGPIVGLTPEEQEFRIVKPDGTIRYIHSTGIIQKGNDGKPHHIIGSVQDITDHKNSEMALRESEQHLKEQNSEFTTLNKEYLSLNEELTESLGRIQTMNEDLIIARDKAEESDKLKSAFLANISHEIRTPMNAIMGFSDLLADQMLSKVKTEQYVQIINASCKQLLTVISDIIDISKIEADQLVIDTEMVNINFLLEDIYTIYKNLFLIKKIELVYDAKPEFDDIKIETDLNRVKQVLCNLLNNAIKFTQQGEVKFGFDLKENFIAIYVKDTGIGISIENQDIIFDRFRQVENSRTRLYGGNGLGLSISKALAEKLGGTLTFNSEFGKGSTFTFSIPYLNPANITENPEKSIEAGPSQNWADKTILIVEDEVFNHEYIEAILSITDVQMLHAWNGENAIEMVEHHADISLVLMDIKMPVINGYEAIRQIKKIRQELPVIAITAYALNHDKSQALEAGFDNYISKPIPKDTLIELVARYLN